MGLTEAPPKCFITDFPTVNVSNAVDSIDYNVNIYGQIYFFRFSHNHTNSIFVNEYKYIIRGLFANNLFPYPEDGYLNNDIIEKIINNSNYPFNPKDKLENILINLSRLQTFDGSKINFENDSNRNFFIEKLYFKNSDEFNFYMLTLKEMGYLTFNEPKFQDISDIQFTFSGLSHLIEMQNSGKNSSKCFIAMSFSKDASDKRTVIKNACIKTGYQPILIDEINVDSLETINDAIISNIRMSKFLIADFAEQKHGVYFEAGFACGLGIPVIYTCDNNDFKSSHFDTNHYPHILYDDNNELENKLIDKINAWIL